MSKLGVYFAMAEMMGMDIEKMVQSHLQDEVCEICFGNGAFTVDKIECPFCDGKGYIVDEE